MNRRAFFGALAGGAAVASAVTLADSHPTGWRLEWSGWREPANQHVKVGWWIARRDPMPETLPNDLYPCYYATTLGVVSGSRDMYTLDLTYQDRSAPILPHEPAVKFEAAKAWARQRLLEELGLLHG